MNKIQLTDMISKFNKELLNDDYRGLVILLGNQAWARQVFVKFLEHNHCSPLTKINSFLSVGSNPPISSWHCIDEKNYRHQLGTECHYLYFEDSDFNVDAFAALSGTIKAGGLCFAAIEESSLKSSPFIQRLLQQAKSNHGSLIVTEQSFQEGCAQINPDENLVEQSTAERFVEQQEAVTAIYKVAHGRANRPLVITADRGRGKTTSLAMATERLLQTNQDKKDFNVVITAPNKAATDIFFNYLKTSKVKIRQQHKLSVKFVPVDKLLLLEDDVDLLLVDEAAGIPVYILNRLAKRYKRVVFSSTVHGYEGAGRGFSIKFLNDLQSTHPNYKYLHLNQPIRWQQGDPLEQLIFKLCCLNAQLPDIDSLNVEPAKVESKELVEQIALVASQQLVNNEPYLNAVLAILVTAHYQTKPSDLKLLLDNPAIKCFVLTSKNTPVAVCLAIEEGGLSEEQIEQVVSGERRFKNQFTPQALLVNGVSKQAFYYSYLRVVRIAVHPQLQSVGLGSKLLLHVSMWAKQENIDVLATSFAANASVLNFWQKNAMLPNWLSFKADSASGEYSLLMTKSLSDNSENYCQALNHYFNTRFSYLVARNYQAMSVRLVAKLLAKNREAEKRELDPFIDEDIRLFCQGKLQYGPASYAMSQWLINYNTVENAEVYPLINQLVMNTDLAAVCHRFGFTGKRDFEQHVRQFFLTHYG